MQYPNRDKELFNICLANELHEEIQSIESIEEPKEERIENDKVYEIVSEKLSSLYNESSNMSEQDLKKVIRRRMSEQYKNIDVSLVATICSLWFEKRKEEKEVSPGELKNRNL